MRAAYAVRPCWLSGDSKCAGLAVISCITRIVIDGWRGPADASNTSGGGCSARWGCKKVVQPHLHLVCNRDLDVQLCVGKSQSGIAHLITRTRAPAAERLSNSTHRFTSEHGRFRHGTN